MNNEFCQFKIDTEIERFSLNWYYVIGPET